MPTGTTQASDRPKVFVSYCHSDEEWMDLVVRHLRVLEPEGAFELWDDRRIAAGSEWMPAITSAIEKATAAVMLVSADFLVSKFVLGEEIPRLLGRRDQAGFHLFPLVVRPCAWKGVGWLAAIQARPKNGAPLSGMSQADAEAALSQFAIEVRDILAVRQFARSQATGCAQPQRAAADTPGEPIAASAQSLWSRLWQIPRRDPPVEPLVPPVIEAGMRRAQGVLRLDTLEKKAAGLLPQDRSFAVAAAIEAALPLSGPLKTFGQTAWAIDFYLGRSADRAVRKYARHLRDRALAPLREGTPPPQLDLSRLEWRSIPGGSFRMGSREYGPIHTVSISPFRMGACTVRNVEYRRLVPGHLGDDELPAVNVNWPEAYAYGAWLGGRLPTEAEWEYACRAGTTTVFWCGNSTSSLYGAANYDSHYLRPVGERKANPWGLHDMHGNVWEWVADSYEDYSGEPQVDPWGPAVITCRVLRGGSYVHEPRHVESACRHYAAGGDAYTGFRVVIPGK